MLCHHTRDLQELQGSAGKHTWPLLLSEQIVTAKAQCVAEHVPPCQTTCCFLHIPNPLLLLPITS